MYILIILKSHNVSKPTYIWMKEKETQTQKKTQSESTHPHNILCSDVSHPRRLLDLGFVVLPYCWVCHMLYYMETWWRKGYLVTPCTSKCAVEFRSPAISNLICIRTRSCFGKYCHITSEILHICWTVKPLKFRKWTFNSSLNLLIHYSQIGLRLLFLLFFDLSYLKMFL